MSTKTYWMPAGLTPTEQRIVAIETQNESVGFELLQWAMAEKLEKLILRTPPAEQALALEALPDVQAAAAMVDGAGAKAWAIVEGADSVATLIARAAGQPRAPMSPALARQLREQTLLGLMLELSEVTAEAA